MNPDLSETKTAEGPPAGSSAGSPRRTGTGISDSRQLPRVAIDKPGLRKAGLQAVNYQQDRNSESADPAIFQGVCKQPFHKSLVVNASRRGFPRTPINQSKDETLPGSAAVSRTRTRKRPVKTGLKSSN